MAFPSGYPTLDTDIVDATTTDNADTGKDHATVHNEIHEALNDLKALLTTNGDIVTFDGTNWVRITRASLAADAAFSALYAAASAVTDSGWTVVGSGGGAPAFTNSWAAGSNGVHNNPRFRKKAGVVYIEGYAVTGTANTSVFTLPSGYRPDARISVPVLNGSNVVSYMNIDSDGTVKPASGGGNGTHITCCFIPA